MKKTLVKWSCLAIGGTGIMSAERFIRGYFIRFFGFELTSFCCGRNYIKNDYSTRRTYNVRAR